MNQRRINLRKLRLIAKDRNYLPGGPRAAFIDGYWTATEQAVDYLRRAALDAARGGLQDTAALLNDLAEALESGEHIP